MAARPVENNRQCLTPNVFRTASSNSSLLPWPRTSVDSQRVSSDSFIGDPEGARVRSKENPQGMLPDISGPSNRVTPKGSFRQVLIAIWYFGLLTFSCGICLSFSM